MNDKLHDLTVKFLNNVHKNYDELKTMIDSGANPYTLRNMAASFGIEMTPQEVKDAVEVIKIALEVVENNNE